jgi:hypothetical protein
MISQIESFWVIKTKKPLFRLIDAENAEYKPIKKESLAFYG